MKFKIPKFPSAKKIGKQIWLVVDITVLGFTKAQPSNDKIYKYWLWLFPPSTLFGTLFATGSVIWGWLIFLWTQCFNSQYRDKEPTSLYRVAVVTAGARLVPLLCSSFQVDAHCTGLFALHVKLDQHLLNLNRKESRELILLQLWLFCWCTGAYLFQF